MIRDKGTMKKKKKGSLQANILLKGKKMRA